MMGHTISHYRGLLKLGEAHSLLAVILTDGLGSFRGMAIRAFLVPLLACEVLSQTSSDPSQTFQIQGTIKLHPWVPPGQSPSSILKDYDSSAIKVTFESGSFSRTVTANSKGFYEADLPLGTYLMKVHNWHHFPPCKLCVHIDEEVYRRELFRVASPLKVSFDITLPGGFRGRGFALPAKDGTPFKLGVRYGDYKEGLTGTVWFDSDPRTGDPVFAEYNLCSLQASHVIYHKKQKTVEAHDNVIFEDASGKQEHYRSLLLQIDDGVLTPIKTE